MQVTKRKIALLALALVAASGSAGAHPGHDDHLTTRQAILRGKAILSHRIRELQPIGGEVLDRSWVQTTDNATCNATLEYYLIAFDNRPMGKTLYILLTGAGKLLRANFDGRFAELTFSSFPLQPCA